MLGTSITKNSALLGLFALFTTLLIAATFLSTKDRIAEAQRKAEEKALLEIVPASRHDNSLIDDTVPVGPEATLLNLRTEKKIYIARQHGEAIAAIFPALAPEGYSGEIELIVGINADSSIAGVRVLSHRETPGLGDAIDTNKSDWILGFDGKSLGNPAPSRWKVKKDKGVFDQFTGATITPRAVTSAIFNTLLYFEQNRERIFSADNSSDEAPKAEVKTSG